ncbi:hypothetical protein OROHE_021977 [Orobanche hederae]
MEFSINPLDLVKQLRLLQALLPGMGEDIMAVYTNYKKNEYKKMQHVWKASEFRNLYKDRRGKYVEPIRWTYDLMKRYEDYLKNYLIRIYSHCVLSRPGEEGLEKAQLLNWI